MPPKSKWKFPDSLVPPFWRRKDIAPPPLDVPASTIDQLNDPKDKKELMRSLVGMASMMPQQEMMRVVGDALSISYFRRNFYREAEDATQHAFVQGAIDLYVDSACGFSSVNSASVWVTSPDAKTENTLNQFLSYIHIEERIRDWASTLAMLGDMFIECIGREGIGVGFIDDNIHPADMDRVDINGRLEGFMRTALLRSAGAGSNLQLQAPWNYVHFRIFGIQQRLVNSTLGVFGEPGRRFQIGVGQSPDQNYRVTTRYGVPIIAPAVYVYKRLKMSEDSVLLARISRGIMWLLYKIKTNGMPFDQAVTITQAFADMLKRQKGQNTTSGQEQWKDKFLPILSQVEDMFVPETEDVSLNVEELGGVVDIKGIVDVEMLESRLLGALRVSRSMLGLCLRGDVKIKMLDGRDVSIKEMADNPAAYIGKGIYACDKEGNVVPRRISAVGMSRPQTDFVRVTLDNGEHFDVTPDHPCMMRDGSFRNALDLQAGDSLMPLYTRKGMKALPEYEQYYNPATDTWHYTHRTVAKCKYSLKKIKKGQLVHHKDFNPCNNDFDNVDVMSTQEHRVLHNMVNSPAKRSAAAAKISAFRTGKTYEQIYGVEMGAQMREARRKQGQTKNNFRSAWSHPWHKGLTKETDPRLIAFGKKVSAGYTHHINSGTFTKGDPRLKNIVRDEKGHFVLVNHKVINVTRLDVCEDAYDIQVGSSEHCFALSAGVFVHNTDQLPGSIGEGSANRISINFAKNAQRLQNGLRQGIARMCQIHLAYLGMDSNPTQFDVHLAEISTAEEEELKNALLTGIESVDKLIDVFYKAAGEENVNKIELLQYLNQKILKLDDIELDKLLIGVHKSKDAFAEAAHDVVKKAHKSSGVRGKRMIKESDLFSYLPSVGNGGQIFSINEDKAVKRDVTWKPMAIKVTEWKDEDKK